MHLVICVFLAIVFRTDGSLSNSRCPRERPSVATQKCSTEADCQNGYSCCPFTSGKYCSSTDEMKCSLKKRDLSKGETIIDEDKCTECKCLGYDQLLCTSEPCSWLIPRRIRDLSMVKCPVLKPRFLNHTCHNSSDCNKDQQCCEYPAGNVCASKDENVCTYGDKKLETGETIILEDNCTFCECVGSENMLCIDDDCFWSNEEKEKTPFCPMARLPTEVTKCLYQIDCSPDYNCCSFEDGKYCVSDRNNVCHLNGGKLAKLETMTMSNKCKVCECRGYDIILCKDICKNE